MRIRTLAELMALDPRVAHMPRIDFATGTIGNEDDPAGVIQEMVSGWDLVPEVPEYVRGYFEVCRALHVYGSFVYEFFTVATERAELIVEMALGARFLVEYESGVPLDNATTGATATLHPGGYSEVPWALRRNGSHPRAQGWRLHEHPQFDGQLHGLLAWARREGLLSGRRNEVVEHAVNQLRNLSAHPHAAHVVDPGTSARAIRDAAEIINHLWGHETPGGRLYSAAIPTGLYYLHRTADGIEAEAGRAEWLRGEAEGGGEGTWYLLRAVDADEALRWQPDVDATVYPVEELWHGGSREGLLAALGRFPATRELAPQEWQDRPFLVRRSDSGYDLPRSPAQFQRLAPDLQDLPGTRWLLVRADHPADIGWYLQAQMAGRAARPGRDYAVAVVAEYATWREAHRVLLDLGVAP